MPFDNANMPLSPELMMLDEMAFELRTARRWGKGGLGPPDEPHCLYGVLNILDHGYSGWYMAWWRPGIRPPFVFQTRAAANIHHRIIREVAPIRSRLFDASRAGIEFNDRSETRHADVLRLIQKLRTHFARRTNQSRHWTQDVSSMMRRR